MVERSIQNLFIFKALSRPALGAARTNPDRSNTIADHTTASARRAQYEARLVKFLI